MVAQNTGGIPASLSSYQKKTPFLITESFSNRIIIFLTLWVPLVTLLYMGMKFDLFIVLDPKEGRRIVTHAPLCNALSSNITQVQNQWKSRHLRG